MTYLVIGGGSIGKRHMRNLISIGVNPDSIAAVEVRQDRAKEIKDMLEIKTVYSSLDAALKEGRFDMALLCAPTYLHMPMGIKLAEKGIHILMEKPLAHNLEGVQLFKKLVKNNKIIVAMGYIFRFSPLTAKVKELLEKKAIGRILYVRGEFSEYLPDWHPWEDYRAFYMSQKSQGGGSILDQSHLMDLIHYLCGGFKAVYAVNAKQSSLEIRADDFAEMIVTLKSGVTASIHTDIFGREHKKCLEIKGESGNILWDFYANEVRHYEAQTKCFHAYRKLPIDFNLSYIEELRNFIACAEGKSKPMATLEEGIETMRLIQAAEESYKTGSVIKMHG